MWLASRHLLIEIMANFNTLAHIISHFIIIIIPWNCSGSASSCSLPTLCNYNCVRDTDIKDMLWVRFKTLHQDPKQLKMGFSSQKKNIGHRQPFKNLARYRYVEKQWRSLPGNELSKWYPVVPFNSEVPLRKLKSGTCKMDFVSTPQLED